MDTIVNEIREEAAIVISRLKGKLAGVRTGRASPALVENIIVSAYNGQSKLRLLEIATITNQGPQILVIQPYDPSLIKEIELAVHNSPLQVNPIVQENKLLIKLPPLSEEQRQEIVKLISAFIEKTKEEIRQIRDSKRKRVKSAIENKAISKEIKFRIEKEIDKEIHKINDSIIEIKSKKIKEITTI